MAWGKNAMREATKSIISLRREDKNIPILLLGDAEACKAFAIEGIETREVDVNPFRKVRRSKRRPDAIEFVHARLFRLLYDLSPFDETLYLDVDTEFITPPDLAFSFLQDWDFVLAETMQRTVNAYKGDKKEFAWTRWWIGDGNILYHNAGVFLWRRNEKVRELFRLWFEEWERFENWDSQVALLRALARSDVLFLTLPHTWNCYYYEQAFLLWHGFGSKRAWKKPWSNLQ